jgi:transposase-like protein
MIIDKLANSGAVKREILIGVEHRHYRSLNNRAEHSHQPPRQWEWCMNWFKSRTVKILKLAFPSQVITLYHLYFGLHSSHTLAHTPR